MIDLTRKTFCCFGLRGAGKSTLIRYIASKMGDRCFLYDTMWECDSSVNFDYYRPKDRFSDAELQRAVKWAMNTRKYDLFLVDEANRFCPSKPHPLPQAVADLNDWQRHYGLSVGYIARRPVQLNQDLTELANYLFIFQLMGRADGKYLDDLKNGLSTVVQKLPPHYFVVVDATRNISIMEPIKP